MRTIVPGTTLADSPFSFRAPPVIASQRLVPVAQALKWMFNLLVHLGRNGFRIDPDDSSSPFRLKLSVFLFCSLLYFWFSSATLRLFPHFFAEVW
jgi:hypothetical protein